MKHFFLKTELFDVGDCATMTVAFVVFGFSFDVLTQDSKSKFLDPL